MFPFSGSNALSKNSVNLVAIPTKLSRTGPKVKLPTFSAKLVKPTTNAFILEARLSPNALFFSKASLVAVAAVVAASLNIPVSLLKSLRAALTTLIWKTPPASSFILETTVGSDMPSIAFDKAFSF